MVGGTSMGAFIGALYAEDACSFNMIQRSRNTSVVWIPLILFDLASCLTWILVILKTSS